MSARAPGAVKAGDALASDKLAGDRIVLGRDLGRDQGGERLQVDLLVEVGEIPPQEIDDAVGSDRVDAGEQDEGAVAIRTTQPGQVAHVGRSWLLRIRGRLEDARAEALAALARTQRGPAVVPIREGAGH
jgi:hypothetical protein